MSTQSFHESFYCLRKALAIDAPVDPSCVVENIMLDVSRRFVNFLFQIIYCEAFVENFPSISMHMSPTFYFNLYFITVLWNVTSLIFRDIQLNFKSNCDDWYLVKYTKMFRWRYDGDNISGCFISKATKTNTLTFYKLNHENMWYGDSERIIWMNGLIVHDTNNSFHSRYILV